MQFHVEISSLKRIRFVNNLNRVIMSRLNKKFHQLTVEDIYRVLIEQNKEINVATIYRVLSQFEESGVVNKLNFERISVSIRLLQVFKICSDSFSKIGKVTKI